MQFSSYRRLLLTGAAAVALFAIPASASASGIPYIGGSQPGPYIGGSSYDYIPQPSSSSTSDPSSSYSGEGSISQDTGRPRTEYVSGYVNSNGSYTDPYYRS